MKFPPAPPSICMLPRAVASRPCSGTLTCDEGPLHLMLKLVGRNPQSRGLGLDLISIQAERID